MDNQQPANPAAETYPIEFRNVSVSFDEFQTSTSPAVLRLTHPESGKPTSEEFIPDPWSPKRKLKEKLF